MRSARFVLVLLPFAGCGRAAEAPDSVVDLIRDELSAYATVTRSYDSNLYRLPVNPAAFGVILPPGLSPSDQFTQAGVGIDANFYPLRQDVVVHGTIQDVHFERNSNLDYTADSASVAWNWFSGATVTGQVAGTFDRVLAGFVNNRLFARDIVDRSAATASVLWGAGAFLAIRLSGDVGSVDHDLEAEKYQDNHKNSGTVALEYSRSETDRVGLNYRYSTANFEDPRFSYIDRSAFGTYSYTLTAITQLSIDGGWYERTYQTEQSADFSGATGHATLTWKISPITTVLFKGWRELSAYLSDEADYYVTNGGSLSISWTPTTTVVVGFTGAREEQQYRGSGLGLLSTHREDHVSSGRLSFKWIPVRWFDLEMAGGLERRSSTDGFFTYMDKVASAKARLIW